ncbi:hypothetical protein BKA57DRAFT_303959 [Linnemannia elongata]|nr:hypothetical protein BKA57DRAFT_303959 [Linnemannia elongata]
MQEESLSPKSCITHIFTLFIYPPTYSFLITYSFIYSSHHQTQCNQQKTITIKKGVRLLPTQKANVTQQLIQVHSVRKVTDSLGISITTATRIRKENKVNIPPPKIGRPNQISLRTKEVLAHQFKTGQMTKLNDGQRFKRMECRCMFRRYGRIFEKKESRHMFNRGGPISNRIMCRIGLHLHGSTSTGRWMIGSVSCSPMKA